MSSPSDSPSHTHMLFRGPFNRRIASLEVSPPDAARAWGQVVVIEELKV
jgi:hypothetical protein